MLRFVADEDFDNKVLRAVKVLEPGLDIVRVQDVIPGAKDPEVLEWAAQNGRILLSHDVNTLTALAYQRVVEGKPMPGVFMVPKGHELQVIAEDILLVAASSEAGEYEGQVRYLPL